MDLHDRVAKLLDFTKEIKAEDIAAAYSKAHAEMVTEYHTLSDKAKVDFASLDAKVTAEGATHPWILVGAGALVGLIVGLVTGAIFLASHIH